MTSHLPLAKRKPILNFNLTFLRTGKEDKHAGHSRPYVHLHAHRHTSLNPILDWIYSTSMLNPNNVKTYLEINLILKYWSKSYYEHLFLQTRFRGKMIMTTVITNLKSHNLKAQILGTLTQKKDRFLVFLLFAAWVFECSNN